MSYNILTGGRSDGRNRLQAIAALIRDTRPDVVGLCECTDFDREGAEDLHFLCTTLGMRAFLNRAPSGHHVGLLYRDDGSVRDVSGAATGMYNGYVRATVDMGMLGLVTLVVSHLHPFSPHQRLGEMQTLLAKSRKTRDAVIMGDMNNVAPDEATEAVNSAPDHLSTRLKDDRGMLDTRPIAMLRHHGFTDLGARAGRLPTYPTALDEKDVRYGIRLRLDYIFATPALSDVCRDFAVIDGDTAQYASDHLPVIADFEVV